MGDLIFAEVLGGYLDERERELAEDALSRFRKLEIGGFDIARKAARNARILRAKGLPAPSDIECLIAPPSPSKRDGSFSTRAPAMSPSKSTWG